MDNHLSKDISCAIEQNGKLSLLRIVVLGIIKLGRKGFLQCITKHLIMNLLDSHDTARLRTIADSDPASVELATLLLLTFSGAPCICYRDEVGMDGGIDPDARRGFLPETQWDQQLLGHHRDLIALRNRYGALRTGAYKTLHASGYVYAFERHLEDELLVVAVNSLWQCRSQYNRWSSSAQPSCSQRNDSQVGPLNRHLKNGFCRALNLKEFYSH